MDSNGSHKLDYNLLGRFLGAGSFGYVFKKNSSVPTAVKIIFKEEVHQQELNRQNEPHNRGDDALSLLHEYNIMEESKTSHPNIVSIFKCGKLVITLNDIGELTKVSDTIDNEDAQEKLELLLIKASRGTPFTLFTIEMELCGQNLRSWLHSNSHRKYDLPELIVAMTRPIPEERFKDIENLVFSTNENYYFVPTQVEILHSVTCTQEIASILEADNGTRKLVISLINNSYDEILVTKSNIELIGESQEGVIIAGIKIGANASKVSIMNLSIALDHQLLIEYGSSYNLVKNVRFLGGSNKNRNICEIRGTRNVAKQLSFGNVAETAIGTSGFYNSFQDVVIERANIAVHINGEGIRLKNVVCKDFIENGITTFKSNSILEDCVMRSKRIPKITCNSRDITNVNMSPCGLSGWAGCDGLFAAGCIFEGVQVRYNCAVRLENVACGKVTLLQGERNKVTNCWGNVFYDVSSSSEMIDCHFGEIFKGRIPEERIVVATSKIEDFA
ncbi:uncharacterized protein LOC118438632 [Folsomia candida]|uniref:Protein kinase domain-containing protein n=1 Tax=Folsomia candida TaxID=158441 RepID=A0A226DDY7_FOLCA|nr:uncharacterized protein LOC118438632 [Folsomia candida]XP_035715064.1 uncharacterized protein LOC118438632 [Folsomia candida]OXA43064.1 hypothetical protein Fcan01_21997 [Folsomia candida]